MAHKVLPIREKNPQWHKLRIFRVKWMWNSEKKWVVDAAPKMVFYATFEEAAFVVRQCIEDRMILKTLAPYWDAVKRGDKTFEVRRDDRGFQKGDVICLRKPTEKNLGLGDKYWSELDSHNPSNDLLFQIKYILTGGQFGVEPGYVVMALAPVTGEQK